MTTAADKEPTEEDDLEPADLLADSASMCLWAPRTGHAS
jgi:hypothetical protein